MKNEFKDYVCRPFCMFYREGRKEDLACQGSEVIERLVKQGRLHPEQLPRDGKIPGKRWQHDAALDAAVCQPCPFKAHGCDFQSESPPPYAEPCGGYIILTLLKERGLLSSLDLEKAGPSDS
jgi:hypothetical protein